MPAKEKKKKKKKCNKEETVTPVWAPPIIPMVAVPTPNHIDAAIRINGAFQAAGLVPVENPIVSNDELNTPIMVFNQVHLRGTKHPTMKVPHDYLCYRPAVLGARTPNLTQVKTNLDNLRRKILVSLIRWYSRPGETLDARELVALKMFVASSVYLDDHEPDIRTKLPQKQDGEPDDPNESLDSVYQSSKMIRKLADQCLAICDPMWRRLDILCNHVADCRKNLCDIIKGVRERIQKLLKSGGPLDAKKSTS